MLYDVGIEIGKDWKEVAKILGLTSQEIDDIKSENKSSRKRGWKMLKFWHSKVARVLSAEKVYRILLGIKEMNQIRIWKQNETLDATALCPFESTDDNTSSNPDKAMFELAAEVGVLWKDLALDLGIRASELDIMEKEASTIKGRAFKMLRHLHAKTSASPTSILNIDDIKTRLRKIKEKQYDAQLKALILPENVQDDKKLCGREEELGGIFETFWGNRHRLEDIPQFCLQVVNGLGGVGKSSVALKYAIKWKEWYQGGVMLFNAESYSSLHNSVRQNMKCLHLSSADGSLTEDNQTLLQYLYRIGKVLLIYDGADNLDFLESYLPSNTAPIHVLLTTRSGTHSLLDKADSVTSLKRLKTDSAVKALQAWRGRPDEELDGEEAQSAAQLVSEPPLEGLPLPIAHAGRYMAKANLYCSQYYFLLKSRQEKLQALVLDMEKLLHYFQISSLRDTLHRNGIYHPKDLAKRSVEELESVAVNCKGLDRHMLHMAWKFLTTTDFVHLTWQMDIEKVKESDNEAMELLFFASFLASKDIPEKLLCPLVFTDASSYRYAKSLSSLKSHTLVDVSVDNDGYHVDIHPLIQSTVFERLQFYPEKLCHCLDRLCCHILSLLPTTDLDIKQCLKNDSFMALIPHLYATAAKVGISPTVAVSGSLLSFACRSAMILQHVDVAMDLCHQHLKLFSTSKDTQQRFNAFYYMGRAYEMLSNPQAAESHFKNALSVIDTCSADEKTSLFHEYGLVLGRLASCYSDQQMFSKAEHLYLTELKLVRQRPEESRHYIATVLNNLALNYSKSGQIQKALKAYEEVLEILEGDQATPPLSLSTALLNMGHCLLDNGHFARALPLLERCLVISRQNLPVEHLDLANSIRELSMCCLHLNNVQRATELANEALAIASHCLPKDHPKTASYLSQLASCHYNARRLDEAIKVTEQCVRITKQNLPSTRSELCTCE
jgi:tetratricopeptide (TPR) repeat protein